MTAELAVRFAAVILASFAFGALVVSLVQIGREDRS